MNINDVVEIFKSAIIQGDLDDAYDILEKNLKIYTEKKWKRRTEMVSMLLKTIKNEITTDELGYYLKNMKHSFLKNIENYDEYMNSLMDYVIYAKNRYNIKYPEFDSKRCNDI